MSADAKTTEMEEYITCGECVLCKKDCPLPQICLRNCGHHLCIKCATKYIRSVVEEKAECHIVCPSKGCPAVVHDNDIRCILTSTMLTNDYTEGEREDNKKLMDKFDRMCVMLALGGEERTRKCPQCNELYAGKEGCHLVQCADGACMTFFCWVCGERCSTYKHYKSPVNKECKLSFQDLNEGFYPIRFLHETQPTCLYFISFFIFPPLLIGGPPFIAFCCVRHWLSEFWESTEALPMCVRVIAAIPTFLLSLFIGLFLVVLCVPFILYLWLMWFVLFNPCCPSRGALNVILNHLTTLFDAMGSTDNSEYIRQTADADQQIQIAAEQTAKYGGISTGPMAFGIYEDEEEVDVEPEGGENREGTGDSKETEEGENEGEGGEDQGEGGDNEGEDEENEGDGEEEVEENEGEKKKNAKNTTGT